MKKFICYFTLACFCFSFPGVSILPSLMARETIYYPQDFSAQLPNRRLPTIQYKHPDKVEFANTSTRNSLITPAIDAVAERLDYNLEKIFQYVYSFGYEPYYGYLKGPAETLVDKAGNDYDLSTLLVSLLTASHIPAQFVNGIVMLEVEKFMNWIGAKTPEAALAVFQKNGIPSEAVYEEGKIRHIRFRFVWVEAFTPSESPFYPYAPCLHRLNPAYKQYAYTQGVVIETEEESLTALIESAITYQRDKIFTADQGKLSDYLTEQVSLLDDLAVNEILGSRKIKRCRDACHYEWESYGIPDVKFMMKVILPGDVEYITSIPEVAGKRISVAHSAPEGSTLQTIPVLQIDGETVAVGNDVEFGQTSNHIQVGFLDPGTATGWEFNSIDLTIGARANICITTQKTSLAELRRLNAKLKAATRDLPEDTLMTEDMIDESLRLSGMLFYGLSDMFSGYASKIFDVIPVDHISMAYIVSDVQLLSMFGFIIGTQKAGVYIDGARGVKCVTSAAGNAEDEAAWMRAYGNVGSNMEHAMIELLYEVEAVSTGKIFSLASQQGIPFHVLDDPETVEDDLAAILAHENVKNNIRAHVLAGYKATIPACGISIGDWSGDGWIIENKQTGASAYMIYGGLSGRKQMIHGGSSTIPIGELIAMLFKMMYKVEDVSVISQSLVLAASIHLAAVLLCLIGGSAFAMWYGVVTGLLICAAILTMAQLYDNVQGKRIFRRREYDYQA